MTPRHLKHLIEVILFHKFDKNGYRKKAKELMKVNGWNLKDLKIIAKNFRLMKYLEFL